MTRHHSNRAVTVLLALLLVAASPAGAPQSQVLTLVSPNAQANGRFGWSVAGAGDLNRDGSADVIVGAVVEEAGGGPAEAGRAYIYSGSDGNAIFELVSPNEEVDGSFGFSVASAGVVTPDGVPDLIVGAPDEDPGTSPPDAGRAYVFDGQDGSLLFELVSPNEESRGLFGDSVAGVGDVNQDGFDDVIVGARQEDPGSSPSLAGRAYVFSGANGTLIAELMSPTEESSGDFGESVASAGDVDRDGFADVIVGASGEDGGRAHVFNGLDWSLLLTLLSPNNDPADASFGESVAGAGDVNQDGFSDLIVSARLEDPGNSPAGAGRAYVFSGEDGSVLLELASPNEQTNGWFGSYVANAGDLDQDGVPDVIVGAKQENPGNSPPAHGRAYVFSGDDGRLLAELASPNESAFFPADFGVSVAGAGDVNQDGLPDMIAGAWQESPGSTRLFAGRAYVFLSPFGFLINAGGPNVTTGDGSLFIADRAYAPGGFGYVAGVQRHFDQPIGRTDDDPLYQNLRVARMSDSGGVVSYRFDVPTAGPYDVTLYLMAPELDGPGNVVMDVEAEEDVALDDLDVTAEAGGEYQALVKTFAVDVTDGTLDLRFRAENKAAVVSAIAVASQEQARHPSVRR